ncbi:MAG TPA: cytochrome b [Parvularculaceae bacterium]|nr:cytochrome b [Parvularculaceae bacterium]HNS87841.1 cytochrome b [Parvularculaceae bacterium]
MSAAPSERYASIAIALHWLIAVMVVGQLAGGFYMHKLPDAQADLKFELYQWHKSFGVTILFLTFVRLGWRLTHPVPALPDGMTVWEKAAARGAHLGFYALLIALPLVGWLVVSSSPLADSVPTYLFGVLPWPHLPFFEGVADRKALSHEIAEIHEYLAFAMIGLIGLHVAAALKHHFVNKDGVLGRMLPFVKG